MTSFFQGGPDTLEDIMIKDPKGTLQTNKVLSRISVFCKESYPKQLPKKTFTANKNGQHSLLFLRSCGFQSIINKILPKVLTNTINKISINRETKFNIDQKIPKIAVTRRWHMQLFFQRSFRVIVRVIQRRVTQNFIRKTRTILKTWSLSIPQTEPEISQNVFQQRKHFLLIGIHFMQG